jgi:glycosyltransferase involved in cell wall biosynthesis
VSKFLHFAHQQTSCPHPVKFLLVNDGSTDQTLHVLEKLKAEVPQSFQVLHLVLNQGKAEAVRQGLLRAILGDGDGISSTGTNSMNNNNHNHNHNHNNNNNNNNIVGFWDGDRATPLSSIPVFMEIFAKRTHVEMVFGSRVALLGRNIQRHASRHYLGRVFATLASLLLRLRVYDTQCGAKLFRATSDLEVIHFSLFCSILFTLLLDI